jgi:hypothetical protein
MADEMTLTQEESLALITSMINKAKCEFEETGISALMWGIIVFVCAMISFLNYYTHWRWADYIWFLTLIAVIPQIIISIRENKRKRFKSHNEAALGSIWISFGISIFLFSYFANVYNVAHAESAFLILYGIPTFTTGLITRFRAMIIGGVICWIVSIISMYVGFPYTMLLTAFAAILAWFIPGLILQRRYLKLKKANV